MPDDLGKAHKLRTGMLYGLMRCLLVAVRQHSRVLIVAR